MREVRVLADPLDYMQAPKPNAGHPHAFADVQHPAVFNRPHVGHEDATHVVPPLDELDELLLPELELLTGMHAPALHVPLGVQSLQAAPPVPHTVSDCAEESWHVPLMSQQPFAQLVLSHVVAPLDPPVLLLVLVPPPSSPLEPPLLL